MPTVRRSRTVAAPPEAVWAVVGDPHQLARWWPKVERVEQVSAGAFTQVMRTDRGRTVRADFRLTDLDEGRAIAWVQEVEGTPFENVLKASATSLVLEERGGGTEVRLEQVAELRGISVLGGFLFRRGARRVLDGALDALAERVAAR